MTRLLLARHGQAHCNTRGIIGGPPRLHLTGHGRRQAAQLGTRIQHHHQSTPIAAIYTSPLPRAHETADIVSTIVGVPAITVTELREPDYGTGDGRIWADVVAEFGRVPAQHPDTPLTTGAETWSGHYRRVTTTLRSLLDRHDRDDVLVIAHGDTVTAAAHLLLGLPIETRARATFAAHNASLTTWEQQPLAWTQPSAGRRWALLHHNDTAHLIEGKGT